MTNEASFNKPVIQGLLEFEWNLYLEDKKKVNLNKSFLM